MSFVSELEPRLLWRHFDRILEIPRGSGNEEAIRRYVIEVAERNDLEFATDDSGNLVVRKPGTPGHERAPATIVQAHLDMVNEKNSDVDHDFDRDPIRPQRDGDYLTASGTTLGSDNGIGVAAMLALAEERELQHGPLELLFTVDEETGLTGAAGLSSDLLRGQRLINVDSEEEDVLTIGCAGGADTHLSLSLQKQPPPRGAKALAIRLVGLKGGHSGIDIHLQRGNATQLLARALHALSGKLPFRLAELRGGNKHNAIPREAFATLVLDGATVGAARRALEQELLAIAEEYRPTEPKLRHEIEDGETPPQALDPSSTARALELLLALPHGVMTMSREIPDLVETSTNLAVVGLEDDTLKVLMSSRSSVAGALAALRARIRAIAALAGAQVAEEPGYPGWQPDVESPLLAAVQQLHDEVLGRQPKIGAVHAGLECGIIGDKYPGMDMISFGPQIEFPHSPDERVKIDSVGNFYRLLRSTLERLA